MSGFLKLTPTKMLQLQKIFAWFSMASLVLQVGSGLIFFRPAFAEEVTPIPEATVTETPATSQEPSPEVTPETTPTVEQTATLESTPSPEPTPEVLPEVSIVPTPEEVSPTPTTEVTNQSSGNSAPPTETGPPATNNESPSSAPTDITPTPTVTPEQPEQGQLAAVILENVEAASLDLGPTAVENSATLVTDKADYAPTDTAVITGNGFNANETYTLIISSTDEPPVNFETQVTADENGTFVYAYQLDGNYRPNYKVEAKDNSGQVVATIFFTDSQEDYKHWADKAPAGWQNGTLQSTNSEYFEGEAMGFFSVNEE